MSSSFVRDSGVSDTSVISLTIMQRKIATISCVHNRYIAPYFSHWPGLQGKFNVNVAMKIACHHLFVEWVNLLDPRRAGCPHHCLVLSIQSLAAQTEPLWAWLF